MQTKPHIMKRHLPSTVIAILLSSVIQAQNPVLNPGFENWTAGEPDYWTTNNVPGFAVPIQSYTGGHSGSLGVSGFVVQLQPGVPLPPLLTSLDPLTGDPHPVTQAYSTLSFYYRLSLSLNNERFFCGIALEDATGGAAGGGAAEFSIADNTSTWTLANVPIQYSPGVTPTGAYITFTITDTSSASNLQIGSYFRVDDVSLNNTSGLAETDELLNSPYPNPAVQWLHVPYRVKDQSVRGITIMDMSGRVLQQIALNVSTPGGFKEIIDVSNLPAGLYQVVLQNESGSAGRKAFVKQ